MAADHPRARSALSAGGEGGGLTFAWNQGFGDKTDVNTSMQGICFSSFVDQNLPQNTWHGRILARDKVLRNSLLKRRSQETLPFIPSVFFVLASIKARQLILKRGQISYRHAVYLSCGEERLELVAEAGATPGHPPWREGDVCLACRSGNKAARDDPPASSGWRSRLNATQVDLPIGALAFKS